MMATPPAAFDRDEMFVTADEVAARYRVAPSTLANQRNLGTGLPWVKIGGRVLYKVSDLAEAEAAGARGVSAETVKRAVLSTVPGATEDLAAAVWKAIRSEAIGTEAPVSLAEALLE